MNSGIDFSDHCDTLCVISVDPLAPWIIILDGLGFNVLGLVSVFFSSFSIVAFNKQQPVIIRAG